MRRYRYIFRTIINFSGAVSQHSFKLRCVPLCCEMQTLSQMQLDIIPPSHYRRDSDAFGNSLICGEYMFSHNQFAVNAQGIVGLGSYQISEACHPMYLCESQLTSADTSIRRYNDSIVHLIVGDTLDKALFIAGAVNRILTYLTGMTDTSTTSSRCFALRCGVCQDFAHLMITLCRLNSIAARYVCGFLKGEGQTHAWVEVYCEGKWRGIDPTHNNLIEYDYIKLAHGRDAADCPLNRGIFTGNVLQKTQIEVIVDEL